ncbi:MAG: OmpH family outer membrane protein [Brevinematales bacterium]|nr:OmpH family outer membrane protein [Brevinematales bacterium]
MRKFLILLILIIGVNLSFSAIKLVRIGVVDLDRVFAAYPGIADIQKKLKDERDKYEVEINKKKEEINILEANVTNQNLTESERASRLAEIEFKKQRLSEYVNEVNNNLISLKDEMTKSIYQKINIVIQRVGMEKGFSVIFKRSSDAILFVDKEVDITADVITRLRKEVEIDRRN